MDEKRDRGSEPFARTPTSTCQASRRPAGVCMALARSLVFAGLIGASLVWIGVAVPVQAGTKATGPGSGPWSIYCAEGMEEFIATFGRQTAQRKAFFNVPDCWCSPFDVSKNFEQIEKDIGDGPDVNTMSETFLNMTGDVAQEISHGGFTADPNDPIGLPPVLKARLGLQKPLEFWVEVPPPNDEPNKLSVQCYTPTDLIHWFNRIRPSADKWRSYFPINR